MLLQDPEEGSAINRYLQALEIDLPFEEGRSLMFKDFIMRMLIEVNPGKVGKSPSIPSRSLKIMCTAWFEQT